MILIRLPAGVRNLPLGSIVVPEVLMAVNLFPDGTVRMSGFCKDFVLQEVIRNGITRNRKINENGAGTKEFFFMINLYTDQI